jgi:hypothetical protein
MTAPGYAQTAKTETTLAMKSIDIGFKTNTDFSLPKHIEMEEPL